MSKERVICPECGHRHTIKINGVKGQTSGVRARRITGNQFEYTITAPDHAIEAKQFSSVTDDLILTGAFGVICGGTLGLITSLFTTDYSIQMIGIGSCSGTVYAWGCLLAETNQRLKRVLPWFVEQRESWRSGTVDNPGVTLTIDHRYRDGHTESGRTVEYFGSLPVDVDRFNRWARDALRGDSIGIIHWVGENKLFSRLEYDKLLDQLRGGGTVINRPGKGHILTSGGQRALRQHLKQYPPTPVQGRAYG